MISNENIHSFRKEIADFIWEFNDDNTTDGFYLEMYRQTMKDLSKSDKPFDTGVYENLTIISDYTSSYISQIINYPCCYHVFDFEKRVVNKFKNMRFVSREKTIENYRFEDSKKEPGIQISDILVKILSVLFNYIDWNVNNNEINSTIEKLTIEQLESLHYINLLVERTDQLLPRLMWGITTDVCYRKRMLFIDACSRCYTK